MVQIDSLAANHVCIVGLCSQNWNRTLGYSFALRSEKAYVPNVVKYLITVDCGPRDHSASAWPAVGTGQWPLGTSSAQFTVYRLRHRCPTARTAARPISEGMTIFCLPTASTSQIRTAWLYLYDWEQYGRPPVAFSWVSCCNNFGKCTPILILSSLLQQENYDAQNLSYFSHLTFIMLPLYLVKQTLMLYHTELYSPCNGSTVWKKANTQET